MWIFFHFWVSDFCSSLAITSPALDPLTYYCSFWASVTHADSHPQPLLYHPGLAASALQPTWTQAKSSRFENSSAYRGPMIPFPRRNTVVLRIKSASCALFMRSHISSLSSVLSGNLINNKATHTFTQQHQLPFQLIIVVVLWHLLKG